MPMLDEDFVFHAASLEFFNVVALGGLQQLQNVLIRQGVEHLFSFSPGSHKIEGSKEAQMMRYRRQAGLQKKGQVANTERFLGQKIKNLDPRFVSHSLEKLGKSGYVQKRSLQSRRLLLAGNAELTAQILVHPCLLDR
jgi:hypothetical protein